MFKLESCDLDILFHSFFSYYYLNAITSSGARNGPKLVIHIFINNCVFFLMLSWKQVRKILF